MSERYEQLLVLALPSVLQEEMLDYLASHRQWVSGLSLLDAEGVGSGSELRSTMERVRGRASRRLILVLLSADTVKPLLEDLAGVFHTAEIAWWLLPVAGFGRLG